MTDNGAKAPEPTDPNIEAAAPEAAPEIDPLEQAIKERDDMRDRWMRALAEMENLRRRTEREVADARTYGITGFARDMVGISDNMRRALDAVPAELRASAESGLKALIEGVELTDRELVKSLEKHGVKKIDPKGQKFDPNFHQAMFEMPDPSVPAGMVAQVVQEGFVIGDRVLRPALVGVSKGGPKVAPTAASNDDEAVNTRGQG
ncbi:heat shock protein GrpE [Variibacter gotjawalensis]|uniref:Protein GrpE n=1 Tax=Variibacter gotjawalensis TaxID=1333996 RepID=A0A0S3Q0N5_9BRAD|nr:nucleotide exchange factor GrpE [Variibacter gotjawalensis]NIK47609.1 molecular chaperone GrpE [Variibacter gotjawalensis]RZS49506.1 molecular chaperone GrpE [Variibacter gotjawalensis]BAT61769.1 heat shock protein GrpE [Variibacter gotjawalensis]